eukprot:6382840-Alexandrium_andersonii.AAC.1
MLVSGAVMLRRKCRRGGPRRSSGSPKARVAGVLTSIRRGSSGSPQWTAYSRTQRLQAVLGALRRVQPLAVGHTKCLEAPAPAA